MKPFKSPSQVLQEKRGKPPKGKKWWSDSVWMPGGAETNTRGTFVKNPKIAANINMMFTKYNAA